MHSPHTASLFSRAKAVTYVLIWTGLSSAAIAQDDPTGENDINFYLGAAIEAVELNSFAGDSFNLFGEATTAVALRGRAVFNRYVAVEGEAAFGVDNQSDDGIADYNNRFGIYARGRLPLSDTGLEIFARLGYATTEIDSRNVVGSDGSSLDGVAYGGGVAFNFGSTDQFQLRMDYTEFNFGNDQDADSISIGLGYNF